MEEGGRGEDHFGGGGGREGELRAGWSENHLEIANTHISGCCSDGIQTSACNWKSIYDEWINEFPIAVHDEGCSTGR